MDMNKVGGGQHGGEQGGRQKNDIDINININMEIQFGERVGHVGWLIGPKLF